VQTASRLASYLGANTVGKYRNAYMGDIVTLFHARLTKESDQRSSR
jgi:hypothetical protein